MSAIDRREHSRLLRILWIDVADLWSRILQPRLPRIFGGLR